MELLQSCTGRRKLPGHGQELLRAAALLHAEVRRSAEHGRRRGPHVVGLDGDDVRARLPGSAFPSSRLPRGGLLLQEELQDHQERRPGGGTDTEEESRWTYGVGSGAAQARRSRRRRVQPGRSAGRGRRHGHGYCRCHGPDLPEALRTNGVLFTVTNSYCTRRCAHVSQEFSSFRWMNRRTAALHERRPTS